MDELMKYLLGIAITVIGWFLRNTMQELKDVRKQADDNSAALNIMRVENSGKFENLTEKVGELKETLNELIAEIKNLNRRI
jgi:predicted  nucleic acid-binding Zn-ribbon protein